MASTRIPKCERLRHLRRAAGSGLLGALLAAALASPFPVACGEDLVVRVTPHYVRVGMGGVASLTVEARDTLGVPVSGDVSWEVMPARLGEIQPDGTFTAEGIGRGIIRATVTSEGRLGTGHALLTVTPLTEAPQLATILEPSRVTLAPGGTQQFRLRLTDPATGKEIDLPIEWRVVPESLGQVDANGLFAASTQPGSGHVIARVMQGGKLVLAQARVVVGSVAPHGVTVGVTPERALLEPGESRRFEAHLAGSSEAIDPATAAVEWSVLPPELGAIAPDGTLTAGRTVTDGRVVATLATREGVTRGYANVAVRENGRNVLAVQLHPQEAVLAPGATVRFEATVLGPQGEIAGADVTWEVRPASLGGITPDGLLTATIHPSPSNSSVGTRQVGEVVARARFDGQTAVGRAKVIVEDRARNAWLRLQPERATLSPGEQVQFSADVVGLGASPAVSVAWSVGSPDIGSITPSGLFTASTAVGIASSPEFGRRDGLVIAEARMTDGQALRATAVVVVRLEGLDTKISLVPAAASLSAGQDIKFRVVALSGAHQSLVLHNLSWSVDPPDLGHFLDQGNPTLFHADEAAVSQRGTVIAKVELGDGRTVTLRSAIRILMPPDQPGGSAP